MRHAIGSFQIRASNEGKDPFWRLGVRWATGVPVTLKIRAERAQDLPVSLYLGDGEKSWESLASFEKSENIVEVHFTPALDRAVVTPVPRSVLNES